MAGERECRRTARQWALASLTLSLLTAPAVTVAAAGPPLTAAGLPTAPHDVVGCACHGVDLPGETGSVPEIPDDALDGRCASCHPARCAHPSSVPATRPAAGLPLAQAPTPGRGTVLCRTCHDVHRGARPGLLRAPPKGAKRPDALCDGCHAPGTFLPHGGRAGKKPPKGCVACHAATSTGGVDSAPSADAVRVCLLCHPATPLSCLAAVRPATAGTLAAQLGEVGLPLRAGALGCGSCHRVMTRPDRKKLPKLLRPEYAAFRERAAKSNLHASGVLCAPCHGTEPHRGASTFPLREQEPDRLCLGCHDGKRASADLHPVGMPPGAAVRVPLPDDAPLRDGKLSCLTCHRFCRQWESPAGGHFVRGGASPSREAYCLRCHPSEWYARQNPHRQTDAEGKVAGRACLPCHQTRPRKAGAGVDAALLLAAAEATCPTCHPGQAAHPAGAPHAGALPGAEMEELIRTFERQREVRFPRATDGRLLCVSCHYLHDEGVTGDSSPEARLHTMIRRGEGLLICEVCHGAPGGGTP